MKIENIFSLEFSNYRVILCTMAILIMSGCSRDYTPAAGATGEDIFKAACKECHEPLEGKPDQYYELALEKRNPAFVSNKVSSGSMSMPKFPNIKGEALSNISNYVVEHSVQK